VAGWRSARQEPFGSRRPSQVRPLCALRRVFGAGGGEFFWWESCRSLSRTMARVRSRCGRYSAGPLLVYVVPQYKIGARVPVAMEDAMGSKSDQIKGLANQAAGKLKQGVGKVTGSKETQARGVAQEVKGKAQQTMGKAKSAVKETANKVADKANKKL
jgi:uncharacterized protein YjbJ (UPF0337 family)